MDNIRIVLLQYHSMFQLMGKFQLGKRLVQQLLLIPMRKGWVWVMKKKSCYDMLSSSEKSFSEWFFALSLGDITGVTIWTAVSVVGTTISVWVWATTPLSSTEGTTGLSLLAGSSWAGLTVGKLDLLWCVKSWNKPQGRQRRGQQRLGAFFLVSEIKFQKNKTQTDLDPL